MKTPPHSLAFEGAGEHRSEASRGRWVSRLRCGFIAATLLGGSVETPAAEALEYHVKQWMTEQGLPDNTVRCLHQTRDGFVWIGTRAGLARFDGLHMKIFDKSNTPAMTSDNCVCLAEGQDGALWVGTEEGVLRQQDGRLAPVDLGATNWRQRYIRAISVARNGTAWIGTYDGLFELQSGERVRHSTDDGLQGNFIHAVLEDAEGNVWVGAELQLWESGKPAGIRTGLQKRLAGGRRFELLPGEDGTNLLYHVHCLIQDSLGRFWWGNNSGAHLMDQGHVRDFHMPDGLSSERVWRLAPCQDGGVLALAVNFDRPPGKQGLNKFDPSAGRFQAIPLPSYTDAADIICAMEDLEGGIWVGTRYNGLLRLHARPIRSVTSRDGLLRERINAVLQTPDGAIHLATAEGWFQLKDEKVRLAPGYYDMAHLAYTILRDGRGRVWAGIGPWPGIDQGQLWGWSAQGEHLASDSGQLIFENSPISCLAVDRDGTVWIGQPDGVTRAPSEPNGLRLDKSLARRFTGADGLSSPDVRCILPDRAGHVWIGTHGGGLNRWTDGRFTSYSKAEGLSSDFIRTLHEDVDQNIWVGTDAGLNCLKGGRFLPITAAHGLVDEPVNQILEDHLGYLWLCCPRSVLRASRAELNAVAERRTNSVHPIVFTEADGLPPGEISRAQPGASIGLHGQLLIPTTRGFAIINPNSIADPVTQRGNRVPPPVVIEQVRADDEVIYWADALRAVRAKSKIELAAGRGRFLEIHYTASSFVAPDKVRFQYQLDPHDKAWRDAGTRRDAFYTNLRPGSYQFRVMARNSHGVWNEVPATFAFSLAPHFFQTATAQVLSGAALVLLGLGWHRWRLQGVKRRQALEQQLRLALERERIAKDMHDDLGSNLTQIGFLSERARRDLAKPDAVETDIKRISEAARLTAHAMEQIVWTVNPRNDTLENLATYLSQFAREFLEDTSIRCRLDIPDLLPDVPVPSDVRHQLLLVIKEALNNIVKHSGATEAWLAFRIEDHRLTLTIRDNGRGFSAGGQAPTLKSKVPNRFHGGNGLINMCERIESLGGRFHLESAPGQGVKLTAVIKIG